MGLVASAAVFTASVAWGWRVLGGFMIVMAAWVFLAGHASFLFPGSRLGYLTGKNAVVAALASVSVGVALVAHGDELARFTHRTCRGLQLQACAGPPECANGDVVSITSPARRVRAVSFHRSCEGGKDSSTHVSIVAVGEALPDGPGNAFIVDGKAELLLLWIDGRHVAISGAGKSTRRLQETHLNGVRISYEERPR